jgi:hypothetical protein
VSLSATLRAFRSVVADWLINECETPAELDVSKMRALLYHGHAVPDDIECAPNGLLSVWWTDERPTSTTTPCPVFPRVILHAKFATCWKLADVKPRTIELFDDQWDSDAGWLADAADCVAARLMYLSCTEANAVDPDDDPLAFAFLDLTFNPMFLDANPGGALGNDAWLLWRMQTSLRNVPAAPVGDSFVGTVTDSLGVQDG